MENDIYFVQLFDIYKGLLTEYQRELFSMRYSLDMSFAEMAVETGASRQSAFDGIKKIKEKLSEYESILHLKEKYDALSEFADTLSDKEKTALNEILGR
ncbi:MAG: hypothetical protein IJQ87_03965 [Clostridia bacterium]|nr:hypothetical protein [Clostridia bacterium]